MARKLKRIIVPDEQGNPVEYDVGGVDADTASAGQVLTADGNGGAGWGDVVTEVDEDLSTTSTNPVQNKVVAEAITGLNEHLAQVSFDLSVDENGNVVLMRSDSEDLSEV